MLFEAKRFVEAMSFLTMQMARQGELVTTSLRASLHGEAHHCQPDATPAGVSRDHNVLHQAEAPRTMRESTDENQREGADNNTI